MWLNFKKSATELSFVESYDKRPEGFGNALFLSTIYVWVAFKETFSFLFPSIPILTEILNCVLVAQIFWWLCLGLVNDQICYHLYLLAHLCSVYLWLESYSKMKHGFGRNLMRLKLRWATKIMEIYPRLLSLVIASLGISSFAYPRALPGYHDVLLLSKAVNECSLSRPHNDGVKIKRIPLQHCFFSSILLVNFRLVYD